MEGNIRNLYSLNFFSWCSNQAPTSWMFPKSSNADVFESSILARNLICILWILLSISPSGDSANIFWLLCSFSSLFSFFFYLFFIIFITSEKGQSKSKSVAFTVCKIFKVKWRQKKMRAFSSLGGLWFTTEFKELFGFGISATKFIIHTRTHTYVCVRLPFCLTVHRTSMCAK